VRFSRTWQPPSSSKRSASRKLIVAEAGKPLRLARAEVDRAVLTFKTAAEEAARLGGESLPLDLTEGNEGRWGLVQRFPGRSGAGDHAIQFSVEPCRPQGCARDGRRLPRSF
jgi:hypothetical protein